MTDPDLAAPHWVPERPVPPELVTRLIARQFPRLAGAPVEPLAAGFDNIVYRVAGQWAFRFPRRKAAVPGVQREIIFLPRIAPRLPLPVPVPEFAGTPSAPYPWPFWGARMLPGSELAQAGLPDARRRSAAVSVGRFLRALHDPGLAGAAGARDLPADPMGRADAARRARMSREILARLAGRGLWEAGPAAERLLRDAERLGTPGGAPVLAHGDLHARHLLVAAGGQAAGVIDWGDLCLADPAVDLSLAYGAFSGPARAALLAAYGHVSAETQTRARILALFLCAALAEYAASEGMGGLLREALAGLGRATAGSG